MNFLLDNDVPEDLSHLLEHLGHLVSRVREVLPREASDTAVLDYAFRHDLIVITCNRDDFLRLGRERPHHGIVIVIHRRSRAAERAALLRLVERAGPKVSPTTSTAHDPFGPWSASSLAGDAVTARRRRSALRETADGGAPQRLIGDDRSPLPPWDLSPRLSLTPRDRL